MHFFFYFSSKSNDCLQTTTFLASKCTFSEFWPITTWVFYELCRFFWWGVKGRRLYFHPVICFCFRRHLFYSVFAESDGLGRCESSLIGAVVDWTHGQETFSKTEVLCSTQQVLHLNYHPRVFPPSKVNNTVPFFSTLVFWKSRHFEMKPF